ncbi:OmpA family protein [Candidatus Sumerlaeota bacterium]|nr:OmpA family protein [Candidatus Sumerlaeota bacterium]
MRNRTRLVSGVLVAALLTFAMGCETMGQHKTASGAVIGAATGAAAGALLDKHHRGRGALIGAAAGGAIGGGTGYYLDRKAKKLRAIENVEVSEVSETGEGEASHINLRIQSQMLFAKDSSTLTPQGVEKIGEIAQVIREDTDTYAIVKGYASSEGSDQYNLRLSQSRADMIRNQLIAYQIDGTRIQAIGMGESDPIGDNATEAGRAMNRRVEIDVFPRSELR